MNQGAVQAFLNTRHFNRFHAVLLLWGLFTISFEGYDLVVYGSVVPVLSKEWGLSPVQAGVIGSYGLFGMLFGSILLSALADRFGRKPLIVASIVLFSVATTLSGFAQEPTLFSWCRFLAGIGFGGALPAVISLLTEYMPQKNKNRSITLALCGNQIGGILAPLVAVVCLPNIGWRPVLWFAFIPLVIVPFMLKALPESPQFLLRRGRSQELERVLRKIDESYSHESLPDVGGQTVKEEKVPFIGLFQNGLAVTTILFCLIYFMGLLMIYGLNTWLPKLMEAAGYPLVSSLVFAIFLNGGALIGTLIIGGMADRMASSKPLIATLYIVGAVCLSLMGMKSNTFWLYALIAVAGVCTMGTQSLLNAFVSQYYPAHVRSTGIGLANGVGRLGGMVGPTLGGVLLGMKAPIFICFVAFALPGVIASLAVLCVRKKKRDIAVAGQEVETLFT
ncbi:4-hydroxybenzoate transporter PcaK [Geobacillus sp. BCO2]|nr:4-hydroxybenzoate transporter PcaK [Geobacillus sp. BCO2]